jgi:hypothetical protein
LHARDPSAPSGAYTFVRGGVTTTDECDMANLGGGWTLLFRLNDGDPCPAGWVSAPRGCRRPDAGGANQSTARVALPHAIGEFRGSVRALGFGVSDAFDVSGATGSIDDNYVDGLSITQGAPRRHLFTYAHGATDPFTEQPSSCPCAGGHLPPAFVGASFRCEAPRRAADPNDLSSRFYDFDDILFDGATIDDAVCVDAPESEPAFYVTSTVASADDVELRLLSDQATSNEDTAIVQLELWGR